MANESHRNQESQKTVPGNFYCSTITFSSSNSRFTNLTYHRYSKLVSFIRRLQTRISFVEVFERIFVAKSVEAYFSSGPEKNLLI